MTKPATRSIWNRPLARLAVFGFASLFIMAPTPGNVGGCSSSSQQIQPGNVNADPPETAEWMYFDQGLCAGFCWRLRDCGVLCSALNPAHPQYPQNCQNDAPEAYAQCVRGVTVNNIQPLNSGIFGIGECPHACPSLHYQTAYDFDVQACSDAVLARSCSSSGAGSIGDLYREGVPECTNVCR
jgi:hypothetical protein